MTFELIDAWDNLQMIHPLFVTLERIWHIVNKIGPA